MGSATGREERRMRRVAEDAATKTLRHLKLQTLTKIYILRLVSTYKYKNRA